MPARRELHTGRYNFLHRGWGPLEPFDDSAPEILGEEGVYTHLVTDHQHYWEDGGATYHNRYRTYEFFRGQEGDAWKGHVADPEMPPMLKRRMLGHVRQDWINRGYLADEVDHPQTRTFDAGLEFVRTNHGDDNWFLQIETFDPHEPFFSYERHKSTTRTTTTARCSTGPTTSRCWKRPNRCSTCGTSTPRCCPCAITRSAAYWTPWTSSGSGTTRS